MELLGSLVLPVLTGIVIAAGLIRRVGVFDEFLSGAKDGIISLFRILPTLAGMIIAIKMFSASGALDALTHLVSPVFAALGIPEGIIPLTLLKPLSGSGSVALVDSLLQNAGADSYVGRVAAVLCGSTETTFYTVAVYYGSVGVTKLRFTLAAAVIADFSAAILSSLFVRILF